MSFKLGATVRLRSGGPAMTVQSLDDDDGSLKKVGCLWFVKGDHDKPCEASFLDVCLEAYAPPSNPEW